MNNVDLKTTKQARAIMRSRGLESIWTNKPKDATKRTMKCYGTPNDKINQALIEVVTSDLLAAGISVSKVNYTGFTAHLSRSSLRFTISI